MRSVKLQVRVRGQRSVPRTRPHSGYISFARVIVLQVLRGPPQPRASENSPRAVGMVRSKAIALTKPAREGRAGRKPSRYRSLSIPIARHVCPRCSHGRHLTRPDLRALITSRPPEDRCQRWFHICVQIIFEQVCVRRWFPCLRVTHLRSLHTDKVSKD